MPKMRKMLTCSKGGWGNIFGEERAPSGQGSSAFSAFSAFKFLPFEKYSFSV
jgi:hypothetical protein